MVRSTGTWPRDRTIGTQRIWVLAFAILGGMNTPCMGGWLDWLLPPLRNPCPNQSPPVSFSVSTQTTYTPRFTWGLLGGGQETPPLSGGATPFYGIGQPGSVPVAPLIVFPRGEGVRYLNTAPIYYGYPIYGYLCVPSPVPRGWGLSGGVANGYGGIPGSIVLPGQPSCSPKPIHSWYPPLPGPAHGQGLPTGSGLPHGQGLPSGNGIPNGGLDQTGMGVSSAEGGGFAAPGFGGAYSVPVPSAAGPAAPAFSVPGPPTPTFSVPESVGPGGSGAVGPRASESAGPRSAGPTRPGSGLPGSPSKLPVPQPAGSPVEEKAGTGGWGYSGPPDLLGGGPADTSSDGSRSVPPSPPGLPQNSPLLNAPENLSEPASGLPGRRPSAPLPGQRPFEQPTGTAPGKPNPKDRTT